MATIRDVMTTDLLRVRPEETVAQVATAMGRRRTGSALVMDGGTLLGIFTERDIVRALGNDGDAPGAPVEDWMSQQPETIDPDADTDRALQRMLDRGFRHFPVVDGGHVVGVVSMRDLSRAAIED
jgi:CBS domain-containing protein